MLKRLSVRTPCALTALAAAAQPAGVRRRHLGHLTRARAGEVHRRWPRASPANTRGRLERRDPVDEVSCAASCTASACTSGSPSSAIRRHDRSSPKPRVYGVAAGVGWTLITVTFDGFDFEPRGSVVRAAPFGTAIGVSFASLR